jgi:hypothetical protein
MLAGAEIEDSARSGAVPCLICEADPTVEADAESVADAGRTRIWAAAIDRSARATVEPTRRATQGAATAPVPERRAVLPLDRVAEDGAVAVAARTAPLELPAVAKAVIEPVADIAAVRGLKTDAAAKTAPAAARTALLGL